MNYEKITKSIFQLPVPMRSSHRISHAAVGPSLYPCWLWASHQGSHATVGWFPRSHASIGTRLLWQSVIFALFSITIFHLLSYLFIQNKQIRFHFEKRVELYVSAKFGIHTLIHLRVISNLVIWDRGTKNKNFKQNSLCYVI